MNPSTELVYKVRNTMRSAREFAINGEPQEAMRVKNLAQMDVIKFVANMSPRDILTAQRMAKEVLVG